MNSRFSGVAKTHNNSFDIINICKKFRHKLQIILVTGTGFWYH